MKPTNLLILSLILSVLGMSSVANADPISIKVSVFASGSLDGTNFNNAVVTLFGTGDTDNVVQEGTVNRLLDDFTVSFEIEGIASGQFTDAIQAVSNNNSELGGFGNTSQGTGLAFIQNSAFENYFLLSELGPVSGPALFVFGIPHATTEGNLRFSSGTSGTFTATFSSVPEPGSAVALFLTSLIVLRRRR